MPDTPKKPRSPYVGAIVLYVDPGMGDSYPAIVTAVLGSEGNVNLTAFQPGTTPYAIRSVVGFHETGQPRPHWGTWHWSKEII